MVPDAPAGTVPSVQLFFNTVRVNLFRIGMGEAFVEMRSSSVEAVLRLMYINKASSKSGIVLGGSTEARARNVVTFVPPVDILLTPGVRMSQTEGSPGTAQAEVSLFLPSSNCLLNWRWSRFSFPCFALHFCARN